MATKYGVNATKRDNQSIPDLELQGQKAGRIKSAYDYYTLTADLASGDVIKLMKIPAGARVKDVKAKWDDLDASGGTIDIGWQAGATAAEAADQDGFMAVLDVTSAGVASMFASQATRPGYQKIFAEEVQLTVTTVGDTDASSGSIYVEVEYVID